MSKSTDAQTLSPKDSHILSSLLAIMVPSLVNLVLAELVSQINIIFVGRLDNQEALAGIGLATALIYCLPVSLTFGIASVLETMVS